MCLAMKTVIISNGKTRSGTISQAWGNEKEFMHDESHSREILKCCPFSLLEEQKQAEKTGSASGRGFCSFKINKKAPLLNSDPAFLLMPGPERKRKEEAAAHLGTPVFLSYL